MMVQNLATHPCFASACNSFARVHLPVAPVCNLQCNYCVRKFSCVNESRPGVTAQVLTPVQAADRYDKLRRSLPDLTVAGIAGPGDALANWPNVAETLRLVRELDGGVQLCLSTNGLLLPEYAPEIIALGVGFVTVTLNCVRPQIGALIYDFVNDKGKIYRGEDGAALLLTRQLSGIRVLKRAGVIIKINCVAIDGVNTEDIPAVARQAAALGCDVMNIIPMLPVAGSAFANVPELDAARLASLRRDCRRYLRQMQHCVRCRADAVGTL